ncbi:toprim domain-containing protein [Candidatus Bathyarchaeota archaeon]|nr:toprim domain-containing protein [Candidatus Bathyarchaeota archaeon]
MPSIYLNRLSKEERRKLEIYRDLESLAYEMNLTLDAVIVEGTHDKATLKSLGFKIPILQVSCGRTFNQIVDDMVEKFKKVAILTDFDEEGERISRKLTELMERGGVKVDSFYRNSFKKLMKEAGLTTLESIYTLKQELFSRT